jgi:hypothetical protein
MIEQGADLSPRPRCCQRRFLALCAATACMARFFILLLCRLDMVVLLVWVGRLRRRGDTALPFWTMLQTF